MIVVTGATGFIGSNLVAELNALGRRDLLLVDDLGRGDKWKNIARRRWLDIVHPDAVAGLLATLPGAEAVFHLGADSSTTASDGDAILHGNLQASMQWWRWCSRTGTPLVYASSAATYGDGRHGFDDDSSDAALDRLLPLNLYGWSKHAFDKWALDQAAQGVRPPQWVGLKFFNVYGPNEYHKGEMQSLVAKNTARVAAGEAVRLFRSHRPDFADGAQLRDFVYVKDCCAVMTWLLGRPGLSGLFNLGTGQARSFVDLVRAVGAAAGREAEIRYVDMPEAIRPNYQYYTQAAMDRLRQAGYGAAFHSLEAGVADYVRGYLLAADPYR
jgi:ADP-L-glycero-D-manno-heptose 6-epimerase